jgi:hypothetical protein
MSDEILDIEELPNDENSFQYKEAEAEAEAETKSDSDSEKLQEDQEVDSEISNSRKQKLLEKKISMTNSDDDERSTDDSDEKYKEAIKKYYKLKNEYDESLENQKKQILSMTGLSLKEKRIQFLRLKRKCVNCKRPVGSLFSTKINGEKELQYRDRHLIALCGDREDPCPLNIDINLSATKDISTILIEYEKELNDYKNQIIKDKNDLLFGYITSEKAVEKFDELKENMKYNSEVYDLFFDNYNVIIDNPKKKEEYQTLLQGFYENIDSFKSMIEEYKQSNSTQYIIEAVELYKNEILPKANELMSKKYKYIGIDYNEDDNTYHLDQKKYTIQEFEIDMGEEDHGIVSFKFGMPQKVKQTASSKLKVSNPIIEERIPVINSRKKPKLIIEESFDETPLLSKIPMQLSENSSEDELENQYKEEDEEEDEEEYRTNIGD